jgi:hypothetical protein
MQWTSAPGMAVWMRSMLVSRVLNGVRPVMDWVRVSISDQKSCGLPMKYGPRGCSLSAYQALPWKSQTFAGDLAVSDTPLVVPSMCLLPEWVLHIIGDDAGSLPTPTTMANQWCQSMQKHAGCRNLTQILGKPTPRAYRWLMGWPIDGKWSVRAMGKSRSALR